MTVPDAPEHLLDVPEEQGDAWTVADPDVEWTALDADAKRERILCAAGTVFSRDGLDAPMPAVAAAAGAGVASIYRQFPSKRDLLAALVSRRLEQITSAALAATAKPGDRWNALTEMLWNAVERRQSDDFMGDAYVQVLDHPEVVGINARTTAALNGLLDAARAEGRLRADVTVLDIRLLFAATRAAKQVAPEAWQRMLELFIDGLDTRRCVA
jgi:AcrR family transcriptional regulator